MVTNHIRSISIKVRVYKLQVQLTANMKNPKRLNINNKVLLEHLSPHPYRVGNNTTPALNEVSLFGVGLHGPIGLFVDSGTIAYLANLCVTPGYSFNSS